MSLTDREDQTFTLAGGRPAGPEGGPPVYTFPCPGGAWPEIGRRGEFYLETEGWRPARLIDRRGARVSLSLAAESPLPLNLSGQVRFFPRPPSPELKLPPGRPAPPGAALFLDPREGWLWNATEAASQKISLYEPAHWPLVARQDLPDNLGGLSFVWLQAPDPEGATPRLLTAHFLQTENRLLVVGDSPADLEPLAAMPGALFTAEAEAGSPLSPIALGAQLDRQRTAQEARLAEAHRQMAELKNAEAAKKARLDLWTDLDDLERRFKELGRDLESRSREWARIRASAAERQSAWTTATLKADGLWIRLGRFLARLWARLAHALAKADESRQVLGQDLETAEAAVREVRQAEEAALSEALNLEERLTRMRRDAASWPARADLAAELERLAGEQQAAAEAIENAQARPEPGQLLAEAPLILALAGDLPEIDLLFPAVLRLTSLKPDPPARQNLANLVLRAEKHLVIMGDFTFWPVFRGRAPNLPETPKNPAWRCFRVAEETNELKEFLAGGGLFHHAPLKVSGPELACLELEPGQDAPGVAGLGLRALGEMGPVNPASALAVAQAALEFARHRNRPEEPAALIMTASPAQGRLIRLMLQDLEAQPGLIFAGESQDFNGWPRVPLVILEPAFEAPHQGHPWAWPSFGRWRLQWAWDLAGEHIWLAGREAWLRRLPVSAPLALLWRAAGRKRIVAPALKTPPEAALEILRQARTEIWAFLPTPGPDWWPAWEEPLLDAGRRHLDVTVLCQPPGEGDFDFAGPALKKLGLHNCAVGLATGFPGFLAVVDGRHLLWGAPGAELRPLDLPLAAPALAEILQLKLIIEKICRRGGALKTCRRCGRPLVLINQSQLRGLSDEQPLQVSCLGCNQNLGRQRLDEMRHPFKSPPKCGVDHHTPYQKLSLGRHQEAWVCPLHQGGPACPSFRVIPGDCP